MSLSIQGAKIPSVVALFKKRPTEENMMPSFEITYEDDETAPDKIKAIAAHHGIDSETLIKRFISKGLSMHYPPEKEITEFENLDDFLKKGGYRKT